MTDCNRWFYSQNNKNMADTFFGKIHEVCKGTWAFLFIVLFGCWLAGQANRVGSYGYINIVLTHHRAWYSTAQGSAAQHSAAEHSTAQHSIVQHSIVQHSTVQQSTAQHSTAQHSTAQHSTAQHSTAQHSTAQHSTGKHNTAQESTTQQQCSTAQQKAVQHSTVQHSIVQHSTAQHYTVQHSMNNCDAMCDVVWLCSKQTTAQHNRRQCNMTQYNKTNKITLQCNSKLCCVINSTVIKHTLILHHTTVMILLRTVWIATKSWFTRWKLGVYFWGILGYL